MAQVGCSSKRVQGMWLTMDMGPSLVQTVVSFASGLSSNFKHVGNLVHAGARMGAPQMIRDCVDGCDALFKGPVVAARRTAAVRYALYIVRECAREGVFVSAIGFFVKWRLEVVKCLTGREREGVDVVMPRNPPVWRPAPKGAATSVRCLARLWVGDLWSSKPCALFRGAIGLCRVGGDYGHRTYRCLPWLENRGWYSCPWEVSRLGEPELLGDEWVYDEG